MIDYLEVALFIEQLAYNFGYKCRIRAPVRESSRKSLDLCGVVVGTSFRQNVNVS